MTSKLSEVKKKDAIDSIRQCVTSKPSEVKERDPLMLSTHALYRNFKHSNNRRCVY